MSNQTGAVCLAVYRPDTELLKRQLLSIANQTLRSWICHIVIDGWDPDTASTVEDIVGSDSRFVVHHHHGNVGFYRNFERAVAAAGEGASWVALSDQDDYWQPEKLEALVPNFANAEVSAAVCQARVTDRDGTSLTLTNRRLPSPSGLFFNNQVTGSLAVFRADVIETALPFPEPTDAAYHDHWLGVCAQALGTVVFDSQPLQDYVQHSSNVLGEERGNRIRSRIQSLLVRSTSAQGGAIKYLAIHRWGWRVRMARELSSRVPSTSGAYLTIARGTISTALVRDMVVALGKRELPFGRFVGLLIGAAAWRRAGG